MIARLANHFSNGYYNSVVMRGGSRISFFLGSYFIDVLTCMLLLPISYGLATLYGMVLPAFWLPIIVWSFTQPLYVYCLCYFFIHARGFGMGIAITFSLLSDAFVLFGVNVFTSKYVSTTVVDHNQAPYINAAVSWYPAWNMLASF